MGLLKTVDKICNVNEFIIVFIKPKKSQTEDEGCHLKKSLF